ncbi:hypothetical protein CAPTEDRAFT_112995, partial [Capitella teleta]
HHLVNNIACAKENQNSLLAVFLDLSKAFDTLDHMFLLTKLYKYGIQNSLLAWLRDFLRNR